MAGFSVVVMLLVLLVLFGALMLYAAVTYVVSGVTVWRISKKLGVKRGWLAFIPVANYYQLGRIAQEDGARRHPDKKPVKWGVIYLVVGILYVMGAAGLSVVREIVTLFVMVPENSFSDGEYSAFPQIEEMLSGKMLVDMFFQSAIWILAIAMSILVYVILYKIYHVMAGDSATWMLALTIFVPVAQSVLFLILAFSKKYPKPIPVPSSMDYQGYPEEGAMMYPQSTAQEANEEQTDADTQSEPALPQTAQEQIGGEE